MRAITILILILTVSCAKSIKKESAPVKQVINDQKSDQLSLKGNDELQNQLKQAIVTSSTNLVRNALFRGAKVDDIKIGLETALTYSIKNDQNSIFNILVNSGANTNLKNDYGESPIHLAVFKDSTILTRILINITQTNINDLNNSNETPILCALRQKNKRLVNLLLTAKADLAIGSETGEKIETIAAQNFNKKFARSIQRLRVFNSQNKKEETLKILLAENDIATIKHIKRIHEGSQIQLSTNFIKSIFYGTDKKTSDLMIKTVFKISNISLYTQYILLIESMKLKELDTVKLIYRHIVKPDSNFYDNKNRTLLSYAAENGDYKIALFLRKKGAETYFETSDQTLINSCKYLNKRKLTRRAFRNLENMLGC